MSACSGVLLLSLVFAACGKTASTKSDAAAGPNDPSSVEAGAGSGDQGDGSTVGSGASGVGGSPRNGDASVGGSQTNSGASAGAGAGASASAGAGAGASAGGGQNRADILAPLGTDDATLDQASSAELLELAMSIGYAHGYALCTCISPFAIAEADLPGCARGESRFSERLLDPAVRQCVLENASALPAFDDTVRCRARSLRAIGRSYAECADGKDTRPLGLVAGCMEDPAAVSVMNAEGCTRAFECPNGALLHDAHCDLQIDCSDGSDERGCGDVWCGDRLVERIEACISDVCDRFDPPLCEDRQGVATVVCGDDQVVTFDRLCDGTKDCATGRDEQYCF